MKHLLEHLEEELHEELGSLHNGGKTDGGKLEYIYRDLLNKVEQALEEFEDNSESEPNKNPMTNWKVDWDPTSEQQIKLSEFNLPDSFDGTKEDFLEFAKNFENITGRSISDIQKFARKFFRKETWTGGFEENIAESLDPTTPDMSKDEFEDAVEGAKDLRDQAKEDSEYEEIWQDMFAEDYEGGSAKEMRDNADRSNMSDKFKSRAGIDVESDSTEDFIESLKDIGVDFDSMKHVANVENLSDDELTQIALDDAIEDVESIDDVDPDVFRHIAQIAEHKKHAKDVNESTSENLVDWATGNKDLGVSADQEEVVQEIRSILQDAQKNSDETSELLETFNDRIEELSVDSNVRPSVYPEVKESSNEEE